MKHFFKKIVLLIIFLSAIASCSLAIDAITKKIIGDKGKEKVYFSMLYWDRQQLTVKVGDLTPLQLMAEPKNLRGTAELTYAYNSELIKVISDSRGVMVEGVKQGKTMLTAGSGNITTNCSVTVEGFAEDYEREPYIYTTSSNNIIQLQPGTSERVVVSLYGGKVEDNQAFTWTSEKPNVAEALGNGQFCVINGKAEGNTKIVVRHPKAAYEFTFLVYVLQDAQKITYITTKSNVLTLKAAEGEKELTVAMQNAPAGLNKSLYEWTVDTDNANPVCSIDANSEKAVVAPIRAGAAKVRVSHPSASYPLEILVRVVNIVENVYIKASETNVTLEGSSPQTVSVELIGYNGVYDKNAFTFEIPENEVFKAINYSNQISLTGIKNGTEKITVKHPYAKYPLEIIVTATKQSADAVDVSKYITTSKNYIRTKVGAEPIPLDIIFSGGSTGDRRNFKWSIAHNAKERGQKVIDFKTTDGDVINTFRGISNKIELGNGIITPVAEGSATITITNSKALYPTEVIVEVLPKYAIIGSEWWFTGNNIISLLNGSEKDITLGLNGSDVKASDYANVIWETESTSLTLISNGLNAKIQAKGNQKAISYIYVKHPRVVEAKKITILQANTQDELDAMKVIVSDSERLVLHEKSTSNLSITAIGFTDEEKKQITWESLNTDIATVELPSYSNPDTGATSENTLYPLVRGIKSGTTKVICHSNIASVNDLVFNIIVVPEGTEINYDESVIYLTTSENVINIASAGENAVVNVDMKGIISNYEKQSIQWENKNPEVVSITPNGKTCSISALKEGEAVLKVTHEKSKNSLNIFVYVGNKLQYKKDNTVFISTDKSIITLVKGTKPVPLKAILENSETVGGFRFTVDDSNIAKLVYSSTDTYYVTPLEAGQACITVSHNESKFDKKVLVVVANTEQELKGFKYLSTGNNVVTVVEGSQTNISVAVMNSSETILDGFHWTSADRGIVDIVADTGAVASIVGNRVGTVKLTVTNDACIYPLEIIVKCVSAAFAASQPYIATPTSVLVLKSGASVGWKQITATLEGGTELDQQNFAWTVDDPNLVTAFGQGNRCNLKAVKAGTTRLQITHPKANYPCYILLICENMQDTKYIIALKNVSNIISMKPTDNEISIVVNLLNGDVEDKYAFQWSLDNWDILEMTANGNEARIKPLMEGQATIKISHPKANNDEAVVVKVQEYANFGFGLDFIRTVEGGNYMIPLQIPISNVKTRIECETQNDKVCTISNTGKIALVSGIGVGQTTVKAKLVAVATNTVISETEMMVVVSKAADQLVYITTSKTVYVLEPKTTRDLVVDLQGEGIVPTDKYNLQWKSSDEKVVKLLGASTTGIATGDMVKIQAVKSGDAIITVSHEKCNTNLTIKINVPASTETDIRLNKTVMRIEKSGNNAQFELKAILQNAAYSDYKTIVWTADRVENEDIVRILGSGESVMVFPVKVGKTTVRATLPNGKTASCDVEVVSPKVFEFLSRSAVMIPGETKKVAYNFVPKDGRVSFSAEGENVFDYTVDTEAQEITIVAKKVGNGKIYAVSESGSASLPIQIKWDYNFSIGKSIINYEPRLDPLDPKRFIIGYTMNPKNADIDIELVPDTDSPTSFVNFSLDRDACEIKLDPIKEGHGKLIIKARNQDDGNKIFGRAECQIILQERDVQIKLKDLVSDGNFSRIDTDADGNTSLVISDGEKVRFKWHSNVELNDAKVDFVLEDIGKQENITFIEGVSEYTLKHPTDYKEPLYIMRHRYALHLNDNGDHVVKNTMYTKNLGDFGGHYYDFECFDKHKIKLDVPNVYGTWNKAVDTWAAYHRYGIRWAPSIWPQSYISKLSVVKGEAFNKPIVYTLDAYMASNFYIQKISVRAHGEHHELGYVGAKVISTDYNYDVYDAITPETFILPMEKYEGLTATATEAVLAGYVQISYTRIGQKSSFKIPVYFEKRVGCFMNSNASDTGEFDFELTKIPNFNF